VAAAAAEQQEVRAGQLVSVGRLLSGAAISVVVVVVVVF
jgi:hypothetical protein